MKRNQIKGFTMKLFNYYIEFVFINFFLSGISCSKPLNKILWRVGK